MLLYLSRNSRKANPWIRRRIKVSRGLSVTLADSISKRYRFGALADRHFRPIFHRLFSCTSNAIATGRRSTLFPRRIGTNIPYGH